jgi:pimeloyl-ACP methyl ester carboxylesterase
MRPEHPSDPPLRTRPIDGVRIAYVDEGEGPAVLALHGLPGSHRDFRWLASACRGSLRLVRVDLPGFGHSGELRGGWPELADFVRRIAEEIVDAPHIVLGHSFGAPLCSMVAARSVGRTRAPLAGVAWVAPVGLRPHRMVRRPIGMGGLRRIDRAAGLPVVGPWVVRGWRFVLHRAGFPRSVTVGDTRRTLAQLGGFRFRMHREAIAALRAGAPRVPSLVAWAHDDPFVEDAIAQELADATSAQRLVFTDGGHNVQKTQAVELAAALAALAAAGPDPHG